ncbi:MAG: sporulation protein YunB [Clostridium sp.]
MRITKKGPKKQFKPYILIIISIFILFNLLLYLFDSRVLPSVLTMSESMIEAKSTDVISNACVDLFNNQFKYEDMVIVDKDKNDKINMVRVNTVQLNKLISKLSLKCNEELQTMSAMGIEVPLGWMTEQSVYYNLGPKVRFKLEPLGNIKVNYDSKFESAGINQTRHSIILNVEATVRLIIPMNSRNVNVKVQVPVAENIIVGEIPQTAIDLGKSLDK